MNKLYGLIALLLVTTIGAAALTTNPIAFVEGNSTISILNKTTNTTANYSLGIFNATYIQMAKDGSRNLIVTGFDNGITYKVFEINSSAQLVNSFTTTNNITSCQKTQQYYYCAANNLETGHNYAAIQKFSLQGTYVAQKEITDLEVSAPVGQIGLDIDIVNNHAILIANAASGALSWMRVYDLGDFSTQLSYFVPSAITPDEWYLSYSEATQKFEVGKNDNVTVYHYPVSSAGIINHAANTSYTVGAGYFPRITSTGSYISSNATHIIETDGVQTYTYSKSGYVGLGQQRFYTEIPLGVRKYTTVTVQSSGGTSACPDAVSVPATCALTSVNTSAVTYISTETNNSISESLTVKTAVRGLTKDYQTVYTSSNSSYGTLKPQNVCWDISELGVGATGISSLDYSKVLADNKLYEGIRINMLSSNARWYNLFGVVNHWYKGEGINGGNNDPVIMSGKYATPIVFSVTPEVPVDPNTLSWDWQVPLQVSQDYMYNDYDGRILWEDFHTAMPYNTSHYYISNWTWSADGWTRVTGYHNWASLNATLVSYGVSVASIDELLTEWDYSTPYDYDTDSNIITLKGYAWGTTNQSGSSTFDFPSCASAYEAVRFNCDSPLIQQTAYPTQSLCEIPYNTPRDFKIFTPMIELYPVITANVTLNSYYSGTGSLPYDTYTYSCTSDYSSETQTGTITFNTPTSTLPIKFTDVEANSLGYLITVVDSFGDPVELVRVQTQYTTQWTNSSGQVYYNGITADTPVNVTLTYLGISVNYTGGNALQISDSWNSDRYSDSGYCGAFDGIYRYELDLNPSVQEKLWTVQCGRVVIPDASIYIDGGLQGITNENGQLEFEVYKDYNEQGFQIAINSSAGNSTYTVKDLTDYEKTWYLTTCNESQLIAEGYSTKAFELDDFFTQLFNPFVVAFVVILGLSALLWLKTGSELLTAVSFIGLLIIGYFIGLVPVFVVVALIAVIAIALAAKFTGALS